MSPALHEFQQLEEERTKALLLMERIRIALAEIDEGEDEKIREGMSWEIIAELRSTIGAAFAEHAANCVADGSYWEWATCRLKLARVYGWIGLLCYFQMLNGSAPRRGLWLKRLAIRHVLAYKGVTV